MFVSKFVQKASFLSKILAWGRYNPPGGSLADPPEDRVKDKVSKRFIMGQQDREKM